LLDHAVDHIASGYFQQGGDPGAMRPCATLAARGDGRFVAQVTAARGRVLHASGYRRRTVAQLALPPRHFLFGRDFFPGIGPKRASQIAAAAHAQREFTVTVLMPIRHRGVLQQFAAQCAHQKRAGRSRRLPARG